jgi:hypothetical protein
MFVGLLHEPEFDTDVARLVSVTMPDHLPSGQTCHAVERLKHVEPSTPCPTLPPACVESRDQVWVYVAVTV